MIIFFLFLIETICCDLHLNRLIDTGQIRGRAPDNFYSGFSIYQRIF